MGWLDLSTTCLQMSQGHPRRPFSAGLFVGQLSEKGLDVCLRCSRDGRTSSLGQSLDLLKRKQAQIAQRLPLTLLAPSTFLRCVRRCRTACYTPSAGRESPQWLRQELPSPAPPKFSFTFITYSISTFTSISYLLVTSILYLHQLPPSTFTSYLHPHVCPAPVAPTPPQQGPRPLPGGPRAVARG